LLAILTQYSGLSYWFSCAQRHRTKVCLTQNTVPISPTATSIRSGLPRASTKWLSSELTHLSSSWTRLGVQTFDGTLITFTNSILRSTERRGFRMSCSTPSAVIVECWILPASILGVFLTMGTNLSYSLELEQCRSATGLYIGLASTIHCEA
jgi:hypothetical protein